MKQEETPTMPKQPPKTPARRNTAARPKPETTAEMLAFLTEFIDRIAQEKTDLGLIAREAKRARASGNLDRAQECGEILLVVFKRLLEDNTPTEKRNGTIEVGRKQVLKIEKLAKTVRAENIKSLERSITISQNLQRKMEADLKEMRAEQSGAE